MSFASTRLDAFVKRRFWLILTVTILFGIEAPLCAMACLETADVSGYSEASSEMPCHESGREGRPADPGDAHDDCGCDFAVTGLLSDSPAPVLNSSLEIGAVQTVPGAFLLSRDRELAIVANQAELPSPDILLLKSTLLI